jgi:hypothetical protein
MWYRLSEKLSALTDKYQTLVSRGPPAPYQSHHRSASGTKRPASPPSGGPDQLYKKSRSFRVPAIFILFVCAVCLGRHRHNIACCDTLHTWDQRSETFAEHQGGNLSHDKMAVKFAVNGKEPRDAMNPTAPSTSAPAVAPSGTTTSSVPKPRNNPPTTPYKPNEWHAALQNAGLLTRFHSVPTGLHEGLSVDFPIISRIQNPPNKESVELYLDEFNKTISNETNKKRYLGPFTLPILVNLIGPFQSSPISIIPKLGQSGKFRLIQNFSYPLTPSLDFPSPFINSFISTEKFPTMWGTFEIVALLIARLPPGSEAATRDVAEAYRTIPLHPSQWPVVVIRAPDDLYYIDKCLSFGAAPSAGAYGHVADVAVEIFRSEGIGPLDKWVDDHVFFRVRRAHLANYNDSRAAWNLDIQNSGPIRQSGSRLAWYTGKDHVNGTANELNEDCGKPILDLSHQSSRSAHDALFTYCLDDIDKISDKLGIPWEKSKDQLFASLTTYIGFVWDLNSRSVSLAGGKIEKYRNAIKEWLSRPTQVLKDVQQLYGKLLHASAALREGRAYLTGLERMLKVCSDRPFMPHRPVKSIADDLLWWDECLRSDRVKLSIPPLPFADIQAFSDASSGVGVGVVIGDRWRAWTPSGLEECSRHKPRHRMGRSGRIRNAHPHHQYLAPRTSQSHCTWGQHRCH